jgi:hypothetical protein
MRKLETILRSTIGLGLLAVMATLSFKSCVVTLWEPPKEANTFFVQGGDARAMTVVLLPSRDAMILYTDSSEGSIEIVRAHLRGTVATHYGGSWWNVSDDAEWFGLRRYAPGIEPVNMEVEIRAKDRHGPGESSFARIGDRSRQVMLFARDSLRLSRMWLRRVPTNPELLERLQAIVPNP